MSDQWILPALMLLAIVADIINDKRRKKLWREIGRLEQQNAQYRHQLSVSREGDEPVKCFECERREAASARESEG